MIAMSRRNYGAFSLPRAHPTPRQVLWKGLCYPISAGSQNMWWLLLIGLADFALLLWASTPRSVTSFPMCA